MKTISHWWSSRQYTISENHFRADPKVEKFPSSALPDTVLIQIFGDAKSVRLELCLRTSGDCQNGEKSEAHCFEASPPFNIELKQLKEETLRNIFGKSDMSNQSSMKVEIRPLFAMPAQKKLKKFNFPHVHITLVETTASSFSLKRQPTNLISQTSPGTSQLPARGIVIFQKG